MSRVIHKNIRQAEPPLYDIHDPGSAVWMRQVNLKVSRLHTRSRKASSNPVAPSSSEPCG